MSGSYYTLNTKYNNLSSRINQLENEVDNAEGDLVIANNKLMPQLTQWKYGYETSAGLAFWYSGYNMFSGSLGGGSANYKDFKTTETGTGEGVNQLATSGTSAGKWTAVKSGTYHVEVNISDYNYSTSNYTNAYYISVTDADGFWGEGNLFKGGTCSTYNSGTSITIRVYHFEADISLNAGEQIWVYSSAALGYIYKPVKYTYLTITKLTGY